MEPLPDSIVWADTPADPAAVVVTRDSIRLAFVAALQHLTAQQRAVLILRDVLAWQAAEVAECLKISVASVNSSLQRARTHLAKVSSDRPTSALLDDARARALADQFAAAFEAYDIDRVVELLAEDVIWEMPPFTGWYVGATNVAALITTHCPAQGPGDMRIVTTAANGQPVLAVYMRDDTGIHRAFQLQQLAIADAGVEHVACYFDTQLFQSFGLPPTLP